MIGEWEDKELFALPPRLLLFVRVASQSINRSIIRSCYIYRTQITGNRSIRLSCDMLAEGSGWTGG